MSVLGGLVRAATETTLSADYIFTSKISGTWKNLFESSNADFGTSVNTTDSSQFDLVLNDTIEYENEDTVDESLTECAVAATQDVGQFMSAINSDQTQSAVQNELVYPINTVVGSPQTIVPQQIIRFTQIRLIVESV